MTPDGAAAGAADVPGELPDDAHFRRVAGPLLKGNVVPFLGAGVNMWGRTRGAPPDAANSGLPDAKELARQLAPPRVAAG